jgi:hypothetical protein
MLDGLRKWQDTFNGKYGSFAAQGMVEGSRPSAKRLAVPKAIWH